MALLESTVPTILTKILGPVVLPVQYLLLLPTPDEVLTAVVLKGLRESENLPLVSASRQELQLQQPAASRPIPFPSTPLRPGLSTAAAAAAAAVAGLGKTPPPPQTVGLTMAKMGVAKANIVNVGRAAASAGQARMGPAVSAPGSAAAAAAAAGASDTVKEGNVAPAPAGGNNKRKRNYVPKRTAQVPLVEVGGPRLPKMPRIPKITDKDIRLPSPASLGLPSMPFPSSLLPGSFPPPHFRTNTYLISCPISQFHLL
jgi:hypothetical protein